MPSKHKAARSPRAHRRYTRAQEAGFDTVQRELIGHGLQSLVAFANFAVRPWTLLWDGVDTYRINGEAFTEAAANELQGDVRKRLSEVISGIFRLPVGGVDITLSYRYAASDSQPKTVVAYPPEDNLDQYLDWVLLEALRAGEATHLRQCAWCLIFFAKQRGTAKFCSDSCRQARHRDSNKAGQRAYRDRLFSPRTGS